MHSVVFDLCTMVCFGGIITLIMFLLLKDAAQQTSVAHSRDKIAGRLATLLLKEAVVGEEETKEDVALYVKRVLGLAPAVYKLCDNNHNMSGTVEELADGLVGDLRRCKLHPTLKAPPPPASKFDCEQGCNGAFQ